MDESLREDCDHKLRVLTETPDVDLHLRVQEHRLEGYAWCNGRRYQLIDIRDEEGTSALSDGGGPPDSTPPDA